MNYPDFVPFPFMHSFGFFMLPILIAVLFWVIVIKGIALWKSARNSHKGWFIALLLVNSLGLLELVYILWFSKTKTELAEAEPSVETESSEAA